MNDDSDAEDVDLDAVLAAYAEEQAKFLKVTEVASGTPSPRSSSTIIASPSNRGEIFLFGGEYFDGSLATFYNNLYVYLIEKNEWRVVTSPNSPLPRSGHAWCRGGNAGGIYLFGGRATIFNLIVPLLLKMISNYVSSWTIAFLNRRILIA